MNLALVADRYRVKRELGRGGMAIVVEAEDGWLASRPVALKLGRADVPHARARLAHEMELLAGVHHPHLMRVLESVELIAPPPEVTSLGLVLELYAAPSALEWARGKSPAQIAAVGARIAAGLATLHVLGVRHGDVSPVNVRVVSESECKLIDFGLADRGVGAITAGTLRVMGPEALAGRPSPASDVYALAATLADLLAPATVRNPGQCLPAEGPLGEALAAMSHADSGRRADAATAAELLARVAGPATQAALAKMRDGPPVIDRAVGREALVARLVPRPGKQVARHVVSGASGSGRSALLRACAGAALAAGYRVAGGVHNGAAGDLGTVTRALAELGLTVAAPAASDDDANALRYARFTAIVEALSRSDAPVALLIDDVAAASPLHELGEFLERFSDAPVLWVEVGENGHALPSLSAEEVREVVRVARPLRSIDIEAAASVHAASAGHAGTVMRLLAAYPGAALLEAANRNALVAPPGDPLDAGERGLLAIIGVFAQGAPLRLLTRHVTAARLDGLIDRGLVVPRVGDGGTVLEATRHLPLEDVPIELARQLASEPAGALAQALLALRVGEVVRAEELALAGGLEAERAGRPAHALAAYDAVLTAAPSSALAVASARALASLGRPGDALSRLQGAGDHLERRALEGEALIALGRYADAAKLLEASSLPGEPEARMEAARARALMLAGRYADAQRHAEGALTREPGHARKADLLNVAGVCHFYQGSAARALELLDGAVAAASDSRTAEAARANLALVLHKSGKLIEAEEAYGRCIADLEARRDLPRKLLRLTNLAILRQELGSFGKALASYGEAAELAQLTANDRVLVRVRLNHANLLAWLGLTDEARAALDEAVVTSERTGLTVERAYLRLVAAELAIDANAFADAENELAHADQALAHDRAGNIEAAVVRALLSGRRGDPDDAGARAMGAARDAQELQRQHLELRARVVAGIVARAPVPDDRRRDLADRCGDPDLAWMAYAVEARAAESLGQTSRADELRATARRHLTAVKNSLPAHHEKAYSASWWRSPLLEGLEQTPREADSLSMSRDVERLLAINRELARDHDPERLLERIIDAAIALSGAERGFLLLASADPGAELEVRTARSVDAQHLAPDELLISRTIARQVIDSNAPLSAIDAASDQRFRDYQSVHSLKLRSVLCLPLRTGSTALGAIYLDHRYRASAFTDTDVALLAAFGDQAAIAIANARLLAELTRRASELESSRASIDELNQRLERELAAREAELAARKPLEVDEPVGRHGMVGRTPAMRDIFRVIDRVAAKDVPVTISGESGTGKELVARALHVASERKGPFVPVNCGAIPEALLESELFGHERGAFTGAVRAKPGLFEIARGGTIFLDEIGDMPLGMQVKLLRVLQSHEFRRVGGTVDLTSDARVVSATNRNLEELVRVGKFREDLWYRLNVVEMRLPALRERRDDLPLLIEHLLAAHARGTDVRLSRRALGLLLDYAWPGNVRELDNELQRAIALAEGVIEPDVLSAKVQGKSEREPSDEPSDGTLKMILDRHERDVIRSALTEHRGRVATAARALGLTRAGLYKKMHKLGLAAPDRD